MRFSCLALTLFCAIANAQDLTKPITYRTVAIPLQSALDDISKQSGIRLGATDELASEPIILSINAATTKDTMDHIASAVGAEWQKKSDNEFLLARTGEMADKLAKDCADKREEIVKKAIARMTKELDDAQSPDEYAERTAKSLASYIKLSTQGKVKESDFNAIEARMPARRALLRLLQLLPPSQIAQLTSGERIVLSTRPNVDQLQLPEGAQEVMESYAADQNRFAAAFAKEFPGPLTGDLGHSLQVAVASLSQRPAKVLLILEGANIFMGSPNVEFIAVKSDGTACGDAQDMLTEDKIEDTWAYSDAIAAKAAKLPDISLSPASTAVDAACEANRHRMDDAPALADPALSLLTNPEQQDPLSFLVSDGFLALADEVKGNLVACPSDGLFEINFLKSEQQSFKLPVFLDEIKQDGMVLTTYGDWTVASPFDILDADKARSQRELLGPCLREAAKNGTISIESAAKLATSEDAMRSADLTWEYGAFGRQYYPYTTRDKLLLRFYSSLTPAQITFLAGGGQMHAGDLNKEQWDAFHDFVYRSNRMDVVGKVDDEYEDLGNYVLQRELTELLPNGIPGDATISMATGEKDVLYVGTTFGSGNSLFADEAPLDWIAQTIAEDQEPGEHSETVQWIGPGHAREINFSFALAANLKTTGSLREVTEKPGRWKLDQLPSDLKTKLDAAVAIARAKLEKAPPAPSDQPSAAPPRG